MLKSENKKNLILCSTIMLKSLINVISHICEYIISFKPRNHNTYAKQRK